MFFGDEAPIWRFIEKLEAIEDPEAARVAAQGEYLMEVFPALSLASYSPAFFGYRKGPRYNPGRKTFRIEDWIATIDAAINEVTRFSCLQACRLAQRVTIESGSEKSRPGSPRFRAVPPRCDALATISARNVRLHRRLEDQIHGSASLCAVDATPCASGQRARDPNRRCLRAQRPAPFELTIHGYFRRRRAMGFSFGPSIDCSRTMSQKRFRRFSSRFIHSPRPPARMISSAIPTGIIGSLSKPTLPR
jgi:hypothetical protein